jgi:dTDP-4-dehydrorhamnose 3,5-epimerase
MVANCSSIPHDPLEIKRLDPLAKTIPYDWGIHHQ